MYGPNPQEIEISSTVRSHHWTQIQLSFFFTISFSWFIAVQDMLVGRALSTQPIVNAPKTWPCTQPSSRCTQPRLFVVTSKRVYKSSFLQALTLPSACLTIHENNALTTIVIVTHECPEYACFGAEPMRSRTAILYVTCPVVCCTMLGCVRVGSVVWRVIRDSIDSIRLRGADLANILLCFIKAARYTKAWWIIKWD